jgi:hypothetical protein
VGGGPSNTPEFSFHSTSPLHIAGLTLNFACTYFMQQDTKHKVIKRLKKVSSSSSRYRTVMR